MRMNRVLAAASLFAVVAAASLRADQKDFFDRCTPGAIRACHSISVITNWNGSVTSVTILVRNLQGGPFDNTGGSLIQRIGLVAPAGVGTLSGLAVNAVGGANVVGTPSSSWVLRSPGALGGIIELTAGTSNPGNGNGGIMGCGTPWGGTPSSYFQTCNSGWVELTFTTSNQWSANNAEIAVLTNDFAVNGAGFECDSDNIPTPRPQCIMATPEPVTMILLGSGLASMGGFGLVRRRKGTDVISD